MLTKRKYVDSHWLIFAVQGVISILFGWYAAFTSRQDVTVLVNIVGATMLALGIVELFNLLRRAHLRETWGLALGVALIEVAVAFTLLFTNGAEPVLHLAIVAGYTVIRGVFELMIGLRAVDDSTDKFIWALTGMCGVIMGFAILNSGAQGDSIFIKYFGEYMMLYGVAELIYGAHNRDQARTLKSERKAIAKKSSAKTVKAAPKKTAKKATSSRTSVKMKATTRRKK